MSEIFLFEIPDMMQTRAGRAISNAALAAFERGNAAFDCADWTAAESAYRESLTYQPDYTLARFNYALLLLTTQRLADAERELRAVLAADPHFAAARLNLGTALHSQRRFAEAEQEFRTAAALGYTGPELHLNWSVSLTELGRFADAAALLEPLLFQPASHVAALTQLALVREMQGHIAEAIELHRAILRLVGPVPQARMNLAVTLLTAGQWKEAWSEYESRLDIRAERAKLPRPLWNGEDVAGKRIVLSHEQGLGDIIQFVRFAETLAERGATVWLQCPPEAEELMRTQRGVARVVRDPLPEFDHLLPILSAPYALGITHDNLPARVPYLHATDERRAFWRSRLPGRGTFRVGLVWRGSSGIIRHHWRAINLAELAPIFGVPGVTFVSLQKGLGLDELAASGPTLGLHDLGPEYQAGNLADTAAIIAELDLVISVDTSVAHLTGALGQPGWVALSEPPTDWRWERGVSTSRWYPTLRLFRQSAFGEWKPVVEEMLHALKLQLGVNRSSNA